MDVTVLEKNDFTGGRCSLIHNSGHRFDQGPSLLLLPELFHRTFRELNTSLEAEGVELRKCEPNYHIWFGDGGRFRLSSDLAVMKAEVEKWFEQFGAMKKVAVRGDVQSRFNRQSLEEFCKATMFEVWEKVEVFEVNGRDWKLGGEDGGDWKPAPSLLVDGDEE